MSRTLVAATALIAASVSTAAIAEKPGNDRTETRAALPSDIATKFASLDGDRDGFVTQTEIDTRAGARRDKIEARAEHYDPARMFTRLDANKDGKVSKPEAESVMGQRMAAKGKPATRGGGRAARVFNRADNNRDGFLTLAELSAAPKPTPKADRSRHGGMIGRLFTAADANRDGRVSQAELQSAALQRFDRADADRDGQVTPEERRASRQARRAKPQS